MGIRRSILLLGLTALLLGCANTIVRSDYDTAFQFGGLKTYLWATGSDRLDQLSIVGKRIRGAVDAELVAKGFVPSRDGKPDFLVAYHTGSQQGISVVGWGYGCGPWWGWGPGGWSVYQYEVGTLVVDIVDARTKSLVWRGWAARAFDPYEDISAPQADARAQDAVKRVLAGFPPKKG